MEEIAITKDVTLIVRPFLNGRKGGAYINFQIMLDGEPHYSDPHIWTPTIELTRQGDYRSYTYEEAIERVIAQVNSSFRGGQSADYVNEWYYRALSKMLEPYETIHAEYLPTTHKRVLHAGHQHIMEDGLTVIPEWTEQGTNPDDRCGRDFCPHPSFKDASAFLRWLGAVNTRHRLNILKGFDLEGLTKNDHGAFFFKAKNGTARIAQVLSSGLAKTIPIPRHTREVKSLTERLGISYEQIDQFVTSTDPDFALPDVMKKYYTRARVAVCYFKHDLLDMMKLMPCAIEKFSAVLTRRERLFDISEIEGFEHIITNSRTMPVLMNERIREHDENIHGLESLKLGLGWGIKGITEVIHDQKYQLYDEDGIPTELVVDINSIARKGAVGFLGKLTKTPFSIDPLDDKNALPWVEERLANLKEEWVGTKDNPKMYRAFVGEVDMVYRTDARPDEQCQAKAVPTCKRTDALKGLDPRVTPGAEEQWEKWLATDLHFRHIISTLEKAI